MSLLGLVAIIFAIFLTAFSVYRLFVKKINIFSYYYEIEWYDVIVIAWMVIASVVGFIALCIFLHSIKIA